mgnify:CR=1 FL=1
MTSEAKPRIKITYATLRADNEDLHSGFEEAVVRVKAGLGAAHRNYVDGAWRDGAGAFEVRSPIDRDVVRFQPSDNLCDGCRPAGRWRCGATTPRARACRRCCAPRCGRR